MRFSFGPSSSTPGAQVNGRRGRTPAKGVPCGGGGEVVFAARGAERKRKTAGTPGRQLCQQWTFPGTTTGAKINFPSSVFRISRFS